jgi:hypothetical protein
VLADVLSEGSIALGEEGEASWSRDEKGEDQAVHQSHRHL